MILRFNFSTTEFEIYSDIVSIIDIFILFLTTKNNWTYVLNIYTYLKDFRIILKKSDLFR